MINAMYISGAVLSAVALCMGADYRAIGASMLIVGVFSFARYYLN